MRFSFLQGFNQGVNNMLRLQEQTFFTQNQVSTGRRILTPADDPVASAQLIQLNQEKAQLDQFKRNVDIAENRLKTEESRLASANGILIRARELTIQAGNIGVVSFSARQSLAVELSSRLDELVSLANTRDASGEYIFSGFQGDKQAFVKNSDGSYTYQGDEGQRLLKISGGTSVPISDSGKAIFEDIPAVQNRAVTSVGNSAAVISQARITNQAAYDAAYPTDYVVTFTAPGVYNIDTEAGVNIVTGAAYTSGAPITFNGVEFTISGTTATNDTFNIDSSAKQSMMTTLGELVDGLNTLTDSPADIAVLDQLIQDSLANITAAQDNLASIVAKVGARNNTLDSVRTLNEGVNLVNEEIISELRDLDYAEALSRLSTETFTLEAAQQSFTRVNGLSLFNFL